jgi:hypothetical protein
MSEQRMKPLSDLFVKGEVVEVVVDRSYAAQFVKDEVPAANSTMKLIQVGTRGMVIKDQIEGTTDVLVKFLTDENSSWWLFDSQIDVSGK